MKRITISRHSWRLLSTVFISGVAFLGLPSLASAQSTPTTVAPSFTTAQLIAAVGGIVLSVTFSWVPKLREWYSLQDSNGQRGIMIAFCLVASMLVFGLGCAGVIAEVTCTSQGVKELAGIVLVMILSNQGTYLLAPKPKAGTP